MDSSPGSPELLVQRVAVNHLNGDAPQGSVDKTHVAGDLADVDPGDSQATACDGRKCVGLFQDHRPRRQMPVVRREHLDRLRNPRKPVRKK